MTRGRIIPLGGAVGRVIPLGQPQPAVPDGTLPPAPPEGASPEISVAPAGIRTGVDGMRLLFLLATLPMFGQVFHYMIDVGKIYYLSKAFPILVLPLGFYALLRLKTPLAGWYLFCIAYVQCVTPVMSIVWLGNDLGDSLTNSVKVWPLTYYFSLIGLLVMFEYSADEVTNALLLAGWATALVMLLLWQFTPWYYYTWDPAVSRLFLKDYSRGNHIFFPITFMFLVTFYAAYSLMRRPKLWHILFIAVSFYIQFNVFKQRTAAASCLVVIIGIFIFRLPKLIRGLVIGGGMAASFAGIFYVMSRLDQILYQFGGSLTVRQTSMGLLEKYLGDKPLRWIFGAGGASRLGTVTMEDIVGRKDFWLTDLGWAGVLFEFGVLGSLAMMLLFFWILWWAARQPAVGEPRHRAMIAALAAYIVYLTISSVIYSFVYAPGELATMTALLLYLVNIVRPDAIPVKETRQLT